MSTYKRGSIYWYKFMFHGEVIRVHEARKRQRFEKSSPQTWRSWYLPSIRTIQDHPALTNRIFSEITSEHVADFAAHIRVKRLWGKSLQSSSVNSRLRVLRRIFHLAVEWGELESAPKINLVTGERHRERVLTNVEESNTSPLHLPCWAKL
jgi:hypothetical protein